jgi:hypothetical protein
MEKIPKYSGVRRILEYDISGYLRKVPIMCLIVFLLNCFLCLFHSIIFHSVYPYFSSIG